MINALRIEELEAENTRIRAALAQSDQPCAYCSLPTAEWSKCQAGFPGCGRADDAMGCPELGAAMERDDLRAENARLREALERIAETTTKTGHPSGKWHGICVEIARTALSKEGE